MTEQQQTLWQSEVGLGLSPLEGYLALGCGRCSREDGRPQGPCHSKKKHARFVVEGPLAGVRPPSRSEHAS